MHVDRGRALIQAHRDRALRARRAEGRRKTAPVGEADIGRDGDIARSVATGARVSVRAAEVCASCNCTRRRPTPRTSNRSSCHVRCRVDESMTLLFANERQHARRVRARRVCGGERVRERASVRGAPLREHADAGRSPRAPSRRSGRRACSRRARASRAAVSPRRARLGLGSSALSSCMSGGEADADTDGAETFGAAEAARAAATRSRSRPATCRAPSRTPRRSPTRSRRRWSCAWRPKAWWECGWRGG